MSSNTNVNNNIAQIIFPKDVEIRRIKKKKRKTNHKKKKAIAELKATLKEFDLAIDSAKQNKIDLPEQLGQLPSNVDDMNSVKEIEALTVNLRNRIKNIQSIILQGSQNRRVNDLFSEGTTDTMTQPVYSGVFPTLPATPVPLNNSNPEQTLNQMEQVIEQRLASSGVNVATNTENASSSSSSVATPSDKLRTVIELINNLIRRPPTSEVNQGETLKKLKRARLTIIKISKTNPSIITTDLYKNALLTVNNAIERLESSTLDNASEFSPPPQSATDSQQDRTHSEIVISNYVNDNASISKKVFVALNYFNADESLITALQNKSNTKAKKKELVRQWGDNKFGLPPPRAMRSRTSSPSQNIASPSAQASAPAQASSSSVSPPTSSVPPQLGESVPTFIQAQNYADYARLITQYRNVPNAPFIQAPVGGGGIRDGGTFDKNRGSLRGNVFFP